ncbi:MAG TPA: hypothetical protein VIV60_10255, partial [Polyangiaceae bacterium]
LNRHVTLLLDDLCFDMEVVRSEKGDGDHGFGLGLRYVSESAASSAYRIINSLSARQHRAMTA